MASMGAYIALAFVAAQFVAFFGWTNLGAVTAVKGAEALRAAGLGGLPLLIAFVALSAVLDLLVGSASAKWAFMAPVFVPMLMLSGFSPELVQAAYRIGESVANIVSPLLPYLPIIIVFARRYDREAGLGTLLATMLPYSLAFGGAWTLLLLGWLGLGIPLGPGVSAHYP
jgi:aminobenzoyl-glutamate transport protein